MKLYFSMRPLRWWKLVFVFYAVVGRVNVRVCRWLGVPVRRRVFPRPHWSRK